MNLFLALAFSLILLSTPACAAAAGAFVAPFRGGRDNSAKHIYSRNNDFTAMILYDKKVTRVGKLTWQDGYGLTNWLWSISEAPKDAFIADDGEHLILANYGTTHFPNEFKKGEPPQGNDVIFSFYKRNALVRRVRAAELVDDVKTLVPEPSGLKWARYVLLSPCGYLTIKTVQDRDILLDPLTGKTAVPYKEKTPDNLKGFNPGNTYRDLTRCYEFEYPKAYAIEETSTIKELRPIGHYILTNNGLMIEGDIVDLMEYRNIGAEMPFEEFVKDRAMSMQSADGPNSSRYATGLTGKKTYNNKNGLLVVEMLIKVVNEVFLEGEGRSNIKETVAGPVFAVRLMAKDPSLVLLLSQYPKDGAEPPQGVLASTDDIRKIVDSVRPLTWR